MKRISIPQIKVVSETNAQAFEESVNEALRKLASKKPNVHFNMDMGHCLYIMYEDTEEICENAEDELEKRGITLFCRNCPNFVWDRNKDGTIRRISKRGECHISTYGTTSQDTRACEYLCKAVLNGELRPIHDDVIAEMIERESK